MSIHLRGLVEAYARRRQVRLAPDWHAALAIELGIDDSAALDRLSECLGWDAPRAVRRRPRANAFPLLAFVPDAGWGIAEQWQDRSTIRVVTELGLREVEWSPDFVLCDLAFPGLPGSADHVSASRVVWSALLRRKRMIWEATLATVVVNVLALFTSIYSMQVYDRVIPRAGFATLWVLTAGMLIAQAIDFVVRNTRAHMLEDETAEVDAEVSEYFFARMQAVRLDARPPGVGTMAAQLRGLEQVRGFMSSASLFALADLPFAVLFIAVMFMIGGSVAWVPLATFPLAVVMALIFSRLIREDTDRAQLSGNRKNGLLVEALSAAETVKAALGRWHMLAAWNRLVEQVHDYDREVKRWTTLASSTFGVLQQVAYVGIVVVGVYLISDQKLTMGGLIACTIISGRVNGPLVAALPQLVVQWGYTRSSLKALDSLLALPSDDPTDRQPLRLPEIRTGIRLERVQFAYQGARAGIEVPGLFIGAGERVGIIGAVGSGKTTLLKLVSGLFAPQSGSVQIDGLDMAQVGEDDLRRRLAYVPQDYHLLSGTLRDNLSLGMVNPGDDQLLEAASVSGLDALIRQHPMGLDLPITEGGFDLSGGQRTLVGLTRAMVAQPQFLVLDEPTSHLDQETENRVLQRLFAPSGAKRTVVMVTHKPQLLSYVDRLMVVVGGRIVLDGKTEDILNQMRRAQPPQGAPAGSRVTDDRS